MRKGYIVVIVLFAAALFMAYYIYSLGGEHSPIEKRLSTNSDSAGSTMALSSSGVRHEIDISNYAYSPESITISIGDEVVWTNLDVDAHTVTSESGNELDSAYLKRGESYSHTFTEAGTYDYYCIPHPHMKGKIVVE